MTTSVRFCLLYDPFKRDFIAFKMNIISARKRTVDTDVVNDVTCTRQSVITRVVIRFLLHDVIHSITATSYDKTYPPLYLEFYDILIIATTMKYLIDLGRRCK